MTQTLKNIVESYRKKELTTPNIQIIDKVFSDETIHLPNHVRVGYVLLDVTFDWAFFEKSHLTKIKFYSGSFGSSCFNDCLLENCVFSNISFREMESLKCIFKDCLFKDCVFVGSDISETTFESCTFSKGSLDDADFKSCYFSNTVFQDVVFGFASLMDSKFSDSKTSIEFEGEVFFNDILDQIKKFFID